jgi:dipeptidase E
MKSAGCLWSGRRTSCWWRAAMRSICATGCGSPGWRDLLPSLSETVWVGLSAGSMVMTPRIGEDFVQWKPPTGDDSTLSIVDFSICPHLAQDGMPGNSMAEAEQWAAGIAGPAYAMDDETATMVVDGTVEVVSEGLWKLFPS